MFHGGWNRGTGDDVSYLERLQGDVTGRYGRLADRDEDTVDHEVALTRDWIDTQPMVRAVLAEAAAAEPDLDYEAWRAGLGKPRDFRWPARTEAGRAWLIWRLMNDIAEAERAGAVQQVLGYASQMYGGSGLRSLTSMTQGFVERIFQPLFDHLADRVGRGGVALYRLERYAARVEWFDRDRLYADFEAARSGGDAGEEVYERDLQRFLFLDGGLVTQAHAGSRPLDTADPLICRGAVYAGPDGAAVAAGFDQLVAAAREHERTVAYLVVLNLTGHLLRTPPEPYVEAAGVHVHLVVVRAQPRAEPPAEPRVVELAGLLAAGRAGTAG
ncbi:hypothetical protein Phou_072260 [Phytohabitans houttuyneae]|uniref:Uncharacterized protein n=1 Tax=Phytohabitans houttuyneae TaxID=1076126 RepID=A0A6V8KM73_9ACTN|nr:hypothetical protein Phou_072260 [Phytohabitans houttuyneae]